jgi:hypothetical protein
MTTDIQLIESSSGRIVSLFENDPIAITSRFTDIQNFQATGGFSRSFRVPFDTNNQQIFSALFEPNVSPTNNYFHVKMDAELRVNSMPFATGHIQVMRSIIKDGMIASLEVVFYSETPNLSKALGTKKLADIAALDDLNHAVTFTAVTNSTEPYRYALIDRGYKFSEAGESGTRVVLNPDRPIYAAEMTPMIQWSWLFDKIIREAGFDYDAAALITVLDGYYMPFVNGKALKYDIPPEGYFFKAGYTTNQSNLQNSLVGSQLTGLTESYDNNNNFATSVYTAPFDGVYTFKIFATFRRDTNPAGAPFVTFRLRNTTSGASVPGGATPLYAPAVGQTINIQYDVTVTLSQGDTIGLYMAGGTPVVDLFGDADNDFASGTGFALIGFEGALYGQTVDLKLNAPDMTQMEFVRDVIAMHNLAVIPDRNIPNKLTFESLGTYIGSGDDRDWTGKLDISKDYIIEPTTSLQHQKLKFTYKQGGDVWNKIFQDAGRIYGEYKIEGYTVNSSEVPNDFAQGEMTVQLVTQPTPSNAINGTGIIIPKFVNDKGEFVVPGPRCLYIAGTADIALYDDITDEVGEITSVNLANHYSTVNAEVQDFDLNFAPEAQPHQIIGHPYNNLFNLYYRNYLNEIYSPEARIMTAYFDLTFADAINVKFNDVIWVKDSYWRVLEINGYRLGDRDSTQVKLIKIINTQADCPVIPASVNLNGTVNFVDQNGDPASATQTCCERYGYTWEALGELCFQFGADRRDDPAGSPFGNTIGLASSRGLPLPDYSVTIGNDIQLAPENSQTITVGQGIESLDNNPNTLIIGEQVKYEGNHGSGLLTGKNIYANVPGLHIGGGWMSGNRDDAQGGSQAGTFIMNVKGGLSSGSSTLELLIEGMTGKRINIPDQTAWACVVTISCAESTTTIINQALARFSVMLKKEGTASAGTVNTIFDDTTFHNIELTVDTATNTAEHRLKVGLSSGHPHTNLNFIATVEYIQYRRV